MKRHELQALNKEELLAHARVMGLEFEPTDTKAAMIDAILSGDPERQHEAEVRVKGAQARAKEPPQGALYTLDGKKVNGRKFEVEIYATQNGDNSPVDLVVNGHNIRIQRGKKVVIDEAYVEVLKNAVIDSVVQDPDTGVRTPQKIQVYPHSAVEVRAAA